MRFLTRAHIIINSIVDRERSILALLKLFFNLIVISAYMLYRYMLYFLLYKIFFRFYLLRLIRISRCHAYVIINLIIDREIDSLSAQTFLQFNCVISAYILYFLIYNNYFFFSILSVTIGNSRYRKTG